MDGETGVLVPVGDDDALAEAMRNIDFSAFEPARIREHALRYRPEGFRERLVREVERLSEGASVAQLGGGLRSAVTVNADRDWDSLYTRVYIQACRALIRPTLDRVTVDPGRGADRVNVALVGEQAPRLGVEVRWT